MNPLLRTAMMLILLVAIVGCSDDVTGPADETAVTDVSTLDKARGRYGINIIPPNARPHGHSYAEWSARWWQWLWSAPVDQNPGLDETGDFVDWNQSGSVWFLAPAYYGQWERTATIPNGTMLFIDLAGFFVSISQGDGETEAEIRDVATWFVDNVISNVIIEVDGDRLQHVEDFRVASPPGFITYTLPDNNMFQFFGFDIPAGTYSDATSEGYYAMLPPLSVGEHTIFLSADFGEPYNDTIQVTYHLTVAPGQRRMHQAD
jgi:hypothetical protein